MVAMPRYLSIAIEHMGINTIDRRWNWNLANPYWRLYCNESDGAILTSHDGTRVPLLARQVYLVPPMRPVRSSCSVQMSHYFCHFQVAGIEVGWMTRTFPPIMVAGRIDDWSATCARASLPMDLECQWRWLGFISEQLAIATRRCGTSDHPVPIPEVHLHADLAPAMLAIDEAPENPHTLKSLADVCFLSREHFLRKFKQAHGITPLDYVRQRRIRKSLAQIADGVLTISQISNACGFASRHHFTRLFARYMAMSPGAYRKANRYS